MLSLLFLGLLFGLAHAFEADHIAAVSSLVSGQTSRGDMLRAGALWGFGHTLSLFGVGVIVLATGVAIGPILTHSLEMAVGVMLVLLGAHVFYRLHHERVHFHRHQHDSGEVHLHLHSHSTKSQGHRHLHPDRRAWRSLFVGMTHGLAGSAALVLVAASAFHSVATGLLYILLFGGGSILGMALMTLALSVPLVLTARLMTRANQGIQVAIGTLTLVIGGRIIVENVAVLTAGTLF